MTASSERRQNIEQSDSERGKRTHREIGILISNLREIPEYAVGAVDSSFKPGAGTPLATAGVEFRKGNFVYNIRYKHEIQVDAEERELTEDARQQLVIAKYDPSQRGESVGMKQVGEVLLFTQFYEDPETEAVPEYSKGNAYAQDEQRKLTALPDPDTFDKIHEVLSDLYHKAA